MCEVALVVVVVAVVVVAVVSVVVVVNSAVAMNAGSVVVGVVRTDSHLDLGASSY